MNECTGNRFKEARIAKGLSQNEVAELLNISRQSISKWERGKSYPDIDNLKILSNLYEISTDDLLSVEGNCKNNKEDNNSNEDKLSESIENESIKPRDEGLALVTIAVVSALIFPLGLLISPFIIIVNKRTNTFYKIIYIISIFSFIINMFNLIDVITTNTNVNWGETHVEKVK